MDFETFITLLAMASVISCTAVITYDNIKYRNYYKGCFIFLRLNNSYAKNIIRSSGIDVCQCTDNIALPYLYTTNGETVCAFNENHQHLIADARKKNITVIDCGVDIKRFIYEIQKLKSQNETYKS